MNGCDRMIYNRQTQTLYEEKQFMEKPLEMLYHTRFGRVATSLLFARRFFSKLYAFLKKVPPSTREIVPFIDTYNIDMSVYPDIDTYTSFNDFFIRKKKEIALTINQDPHTVIAPADSKLSIFNISELGLFTIKGVQYTLTELLRDQHIAQSFIGGTGLIYRLTTDDYHRYCHVSDGNIIAHQVLKGKLHTVGPMAHGIVKAISENQREYVRIATDNGSELLFMEVGAMLIGAIHNHQTTVGATVKKGEEKGYFSYGGSTIVVLYKKDAIKIDADICEYAAQNIEVKVTYGEKVGMWQDASRQSNDAVW